MSFSPKDIGCVNIHSTKLVIVKEITTNKQTKKETMNSFESDQINKELERFRSQTLEFDHCFIV